MSRLFAASGSIRRGFTDLAAAVGAVCCVLDREGDGDEICWLDGELLATALASDLKKLAATWPDAEG